MFPIMNVFFDFLDKHSLKTNFTQIQINIDFLLSQGCYITTISIYDVYRQNDVKGSETLHVNNKNYNFFPGINKAKML